VTTSPPAPDPRPAPETLVDEVEIRAHVQRLAAEIATDHPDGVVLVGVLKGALIFLADLARAIPDIEVEVDFIAISRYAPDSGRVRILHDVALELGGRDVDTGLTLGYLLEHVGAQQPRRVEVCALLDRPTRRILPVSVRYVGVEIPDVFVLGYGLHAADLYRNVPRIVAADRTVVSEQPDAYVDVLYGT
jgi:hypoxanthine phosphoribosyltransferase